MGNRQLPMCVILTELQADAQKQADKGDPLRERVGLEKRNVLLVVSVRWCHSSDSWFLLFFCQWDQKAQCL